MLSILFWKYFSIIMLSLIFLLYGIYLHVIYLVFVIVLLQKWLVILNALFFCLNFRSILSILILNSGILTKIVLNLCMNLRKFDLIIYRFYIHEHSISLHFLDFKKCFSVKFMILSIKDLYIIFINFFLDKLFSEC